MNLQDTSCLVLVLKPVNLFFKRERQNIYCMLGIHYFSTNNGFCIMKSS